MNKEFFKLKNDQWVVDVPVLKMVLNEANIVEDGDTKIIFGFGPILVSENEDGSNHEEHSLLLATKFRTKPVEVEYDRDEEEYTFIYYKDKAEEFPFCMNKNIVKDITNVEYMFNLISAGKVTTKIDWRDYIEVILNNMKLNKQLDVSERDIEILLAEYLRDAEDPTQPVRLTGNDEFTVLSFRNLTAQQSTFNSLTFEDPKTMLGAAITRSPEEETPSPLEKYMKM